MIAARWHIGDKIGVQGEVCDIKESANSIAYILYSKEHQAATFAKAPRAEALARYTQLVELYAQAVQNWRKLPPHQNVVKAHYFTLHDEDSPLLFMDYVGGGHLGELIDTPRLVNDLRQALHLAIQLGDGLAHAQAYGLHAHGNLKPNSCLLTDDGTLKVTDFGLGEQLYRACNTTGVNLQEEKAKGFLGRIFSTSPAEGDAPYNPYLAPELADSPQQANTQADIYAFGVILYEMVSGRQPYDSSEWVKLVRKQNVKLSSLVIDEGSEHVATLRALNALAQQCLALNPEQRPLNFAEVVEQLRAIYQQFTGTSAPNPLTGRELEAYQLLVEGDGLGQLGYCVEELVYIDRALTLAPHMSLAWSNKGAALSATKRHEDALTCLDHALRLKPNSPAALAHKGNALMELNRYEEALACLKQALSIDPNMAGAWIKKGVCLSALGRDEGSSCDKYALELALHSEIAWEDKHDGVSLRNRISIACTKKGGALARQARFKEALACFERAAELSPDWAQARVFKGDALMELENYQDASAAYDGALALNLSSEELLVKKGSSLRGVNQQAEALHYFERALTLNPQNVRALINIAAILGSSRHYTEALEYCDRAIKVDPHDEEVWLMKGMLWSQLRRPNLAAECYKMAEQLRYPAAQ